MRQVFVGVALWCSLAHSQVLLHSGAGAQLGTGGSVVRAGGRYFAFFSDGQQLLYRESADGLSFTPAAAATSTAPDLGFAVARSPAGDRIGVAWGNQAGAQSTLFYREASVAPGPLLFGAAMTLSTSAIDVRGYKPVLAFNTAGRPVVSALAYNQLYAGPLTGCGAPRSWRAAPHYFDGTAWQYIGYCNNFSSAQEASSLAIAALGNGQVVHAFVQGVGVLGSGIINPTGPPATAELGEPWTLNGTLTRTLSNQLTAAPSVDVPSSVHYVFVNQAGALVYARQDALSTGNGASALDVTQVNPSGTSPTLSRPLSAGGCHALTWIEGTSLRRRTFTAGVSSIAPAQTLLTRVVAPTALTAEREAAVVPALEWLEGTNVYFALASTAPAPTLTANPTVALADGTTSVSLSNSGFQDACNLPLTGGALLTATATGGTLIDTDLDPTMPGLQLASSAGGTASFTLRAPSSPAMVEVTLQPTAGGPAAIAFVQFDPVPTDAGTGGGGGAAATGGGGGEGAGGGAGGSGGGAAAEEDGGIAPMPPDKPSLRLGVGCACSSPGGLDFFALALLAAVRSRGRTSTPTPRRSSAPEQRSPRWRSGCRCC